MDKQTKDIDKYIICRIGGIRDYPGSCNMILGIDPSGSMQKVFKGKCKDCKHGEVEYENQNRNEKDK